MTSDEPRTSLLLPGVTATDSFLARQTRLMLSSYRRWTGNTLWPEDKADDILVKEVFNASFVLCSAGPESDPVLNYGNAQALKLWEMDWKTLTSTPGRHTAEAPERGAREQFLRTVKEKGYIDNYSGIRVSSTGRRFEIKNATVWNLLDSQGRYAGQAATFHAWRFL